MSPIRRADPIVSLAVVLSAGCLPFTGPGGGGPNRTVLGGIDEVTAAVVQVFHEVGLPVQRADPGMVQTGPTRLREGWGTTPLDRVVACGNDGDIPVYGHVIEMRVSAFVAAASDVQPPTAGPVPGVPPQTSTGPRSRVSINSDGRMLTGGGQPCRLRDSFADHILERVAARTGRGGSIVAER